jgi:hypothetical protein
MWLHRACANPLTLTREEMSMHRPRRTRRCTDEYGGIEYGGLPVAPALASASALDELNHLTARSISL